MNIWGFDVHYFNLVCCGNVVAYDLITFIDICYTDCLPEPVFFCEVSVGVVDSNLERKAPAVVKMFDQIKSGNVSAHKHFLVMN